MEKLSFFQTFPWLPLLLQTLTSAVDVERVNGVSVHMIVKRKANTTAVGTRES